MRKIKKGPVAVLLIIIILFLIVLFVPKLKIELKTKEINVNSDYKIEYKASYKNKDITSQIKLDNNIDITKIGKYKINFYYDNKKISKYIKVVDRENPIIKLNSGDITVPLNGEYKDPGYIVNDNYDTDLKVKIEGNVDTSKEGEYIIKYITKDKSNNQTIVERKVKVSGISPLEMNIKDFTLDGYFEGTILKETEDAGDIYINNIIFAGDSVPLYYVMSNHIKGRQLWHKEGINAEAALLQKIYIAHQDSGLTFVDAFKKYKPETVIMTLGMNSVATMTPNYFINCYKKLIDQIKSVSPDTKLIIQSIPPVDSSLDEKEDGLTNKKINEFNYRIAQMCEEMNLPFLNSAVVLKDENGQCKKGFCYLEKNNYGVHQTKEGNEEVFNYIRTHSFK